VRLLKILGATVAGLVFLAGIALGMGYLYLRSGVQSGAGEVRVQGLSGSIEIVRDEFGVPHVWAEAEKDIWFALGFLHGQDRATQLELVRLLGQGRVAEVVGPRALPFDRLNRALGAAESARRAYAQAGPELRARADSYAAGVNAALSVREGAPPPEFLATGHKPERWEAWHTLLWGQMMGLTLSGDWREELFRLRLGARFTPPLADALWPQWDGEAPAIADAAGAEFARWAEAIHAALPAPLGPSQASNHWAVSGAHTQSGAPILSNDPHLGLAAPGQWYLVRLEARDTGAVYAGASAPGAPALVLGHNGKIAWGFTTTNADTADLTIERIDPVDSNRYLTPDGPRAFETREETFQARGAAPLTVVQRRTRNGVVISDFDRNAAGAAPEGHVLALMVPGLALAETTAEAIVALNRAKDVGEGLAALRHWVAPVQNVLLADKQGRIAMRVAGAVPIRASAPSMLPKRGWEAGAGWTGFVPFERMPQSLDPASGKLSNANDRVVGREFPFHLAFSFDAPYRQRRIQEMLATPGKQSAAFHEAMLADPVSLFAREAIGRAAWLAPVEPRARAAIERLRAWDHAVRAGGTEGLIFNVWAREIQRRALARALGDLAPDGGRDRAKLVLDVLARISPYCDGDCARMAEDALVAAVQWIELRHGSDMARWRWGAEHVAPFENPVLARIPAIGGWLAVDVPTSGDYFTVNRGASFGARDADRPFAHNHGAGYRAVYDLADLDASLFMVAPGQSGHPLSPHWADLAPIWASGRHLRLVRTRGELGPNAPVTWLRPL
jgi:penicillin G amidase